MFGRRAPSYLFTHQPYFSSITKFAELDEFLGCHVEDGPEACEEEIDVSVSGRAHTFLHAFLLSIVVVLTSL